MPVPEDYDISVDIPATIKTVGEGKVIQIVGAISNDDKQVVFLKFLTEEEYLEELGVDE